MTITLTNPETRAAATIARLLAFTANVELRYAEAHFQVGFDVGDGFTTTRRVVLRFSDDPNAEANFTFTQLVNNVPEVRDLRRALETQAVALNVFDGTVT